jgi:MFS family permease
VLYAVGSGISAVMVSFVSRLADRVGPRRVLIWVSIALGGACFAMAAANSLVLIMVALASLRALGQGSLPVNGTLLVAQWFVRYRARAIAVMTLGFAVSTSVLAPVCTVLIKEIGWRETYALLGVMVWILIIPGALFLVKDRPEDIGLLPDGDSAPTATGTSPPVRALPPGPDRRKVFTSARFWMLALPMATSPLVGTALIFHQAGILGERGLSEEVSGVVFVPLAIGSAASVMVAGFFIDKAGPKPAFVISMLLLLAAMGLVQVIDSVAMAIFYGAVMGASNGISQNISGVMWVHFYGRENLGRIQGSAMTIGISGAALGPLPLALMEDAFDSFAPGIVMLMLLPVLAIPAVAMAKPPVPESTS